MRETTMLIVRDDLGRFLLEQRPPTGIWAQLWSLPETENASSAGEVLRERYGVRVSSALPLGAFVHSFSHYHLRVTPLLLDGTRETRVADPSGRGWFAREDLPSLGLPSPVRKLLESVCKETQWREPSTA